MLAPAFLPPSAYPLWGQSEKQRRPSCCAALFSNSLSSDVSSIVLVTNLKHSTIWADRKEVNSVPARRSATYLAFHWLWWKCEFCVLTVNSGFSAAEVQQCVSAVSGLCSWKECIYFVLAHAKWLAPGCPSQQCVQIKCWPKHNKNTLSYMSKSWLIYGFFWELSPPALPIRSQKECLLFLFRVLS